MKLTTDFITLFISKLLNAPMLLIETALLGRLFGPIGFGQWYLAVAAATMLHTVLLNWTYNITIRFGCDEWGSHHSIHHTLLTRLPFIIFGLGIAALTLILQPVNWLTSFYTLPQQYTGLVFLNILVLWLTFETQSTYQATLAISALSWVTPAITAFSICFLLIALQYHLSQFYILANSIATLKILLWGCALICILIKAINKPCRFPTYHELKTVAAYSWPLLPTFLVAYFSQWGNHVILAHYVSSDTVGLWGASYQMMLGVISLNSVFVTVLTPWIITRAKHSKETLYFYSNQVIPTIICVWLIGLVFLITFLPSLFTLFMGEKFESANSILIILVFGILTSTFSNLYGILFNVQHRLHKVLFYNFIITIVNLGISMILIPTMGAKGAAIGTAISYIIGHSLTILDQHQFMNISTKRIAILFLLTLCIGLLQWMAGLLWWLRFSSGMISIFLLIITARKISAVEYTLITKLFSGALHPIAVLLRKTLVSTT